MSAWLVSAGLIVVLVGQADRENPAAAPAEVIDKAIQDLGDVRFAVRQRASRALWEQGLAAQAALQRAAESGDRETRQRAGAILKDFRYGILPGVPDGTVALIRQFRDGNGAERPAAFQRLADRGEFETLTRLIGLEPDASMRRQLLVLLVQNPRAVDKLVDLDHLEKLLAAVAADQDEAWRRTMLAQMLFSEKMLQRLAEKRQLDLVVKVIDRETSAETRRQMLSVLFQNSAAVTSLVEKEQLDLLLKLIQKEPEKRIRGPWIQQILANPETVARLAGDERLARVLKFAQENMDAEQRSQLLPQLFQNPGLVQTLLAKRGIDGLLALAGTETDPAARGRVLAALVTSPAVGQQLAQTGQRDLALELARKEKDAAVREEYLKALLAGGSGYFLFQDDESRKAVWELIKAEPGRATKQTVDWRGDAVSQLLQYSSRQEWLQQEGEMAWLVGFLRERASPEPRGRILERLATDYRLQPILHRHAKLDELLQMVKDVPGESRGRLRARLVVSPDPFRQLLPDRRIELLVTLAKEESDAAVRCAYLQELFANQPAMSALVHGGFYDALWALVTAEEDPVRHATLRAEFVRTSAGLQALTDKQSIDALVQFAQNQKLPEMRRQYLQRLLSNEPALALLIDKGYYDALFSLANDKDDEASRLALLGSFYASQKVIQRLAAQKQIAALLEFADELPNDQQLYNYLQRMLMNQQAIAVLIEEGRLESLLSLARKPKEKYHRGSLIGMLLGSAPVVRQMAASDQCKALFALIEKEPDETRQQLLYGLFARSETVAVLVDNGRLDDLLALLKKESRPEVRGQFLARLVGQPRVLERLAAEKRLALLIELAREQENANVRRQIVQGLVSQPSAVERLLEQGHFDAFYELATNDRDPAQRARLLGQLLGHSKSVSHLVAQKKIALLLDLVEEQAEEPFRRSYLAGILASPAVVAALVEHREFERLVKLCRSPADPNARRRRLAELLLSPGAIGQLVQSGSLDGIVQEVLQEPEATARRQFLERLFGNPQALSLLVDKGHYEALFALANDDSEPPQRLALLIPFYCNSKVSERLRERKQLDVFIALAQQCSDSQQLYRFLQSVVYNQALVAALAEQGHAAALLDLAVKPSEPYLRSSLLRGLLSVPSFVQHVAEDEPWKKLLELLSKQTPDRQELYYPLTSQRETVAILVGKGRLDDLLTLVKQEPQSGTRGQLLVTLVLQPPVQQHLTAEKWSKLIIDLARQQEDETVRQQFLQSLFLNPPAVGTLLDQGQFEALYELAAGALDPAQRAQQLGALLANSKTIEYLVANKKVDLLLSLAKEPPDERVRREFLARILASPAAVNALIEHGGFGQLVELCRSPQDANARRRMLAELLLSESALKELMTAGSLDGIVREALEEPDTAARRQFLQRLFGNSAALSLLIDKGHFEALSSAARGDTDPQARRQLLSAFYINPKVVQRLTETKQVAELLALAEGFSDGHQLYSFLQQLFSQDRAMTALLDQGQAEALLALARKPSEPYLRASLLQVLFRSKGIAQHLTTDERWKELLESIRSQPAETRSQLAAALLSRPENVAILVGKDRLEDILTLVDQQTRDPFQRNYLLQIFSNSAAIKALLEQGQLARLIKLCREAGDSNVRRMFVQRLVYEDVCRRALGQGKSGRELLALLQVETDPTIRQTNARMVLTSPPLRQALIDSGQADVLFEVVKLDPDESARRANLRQILYSPSGLVSYYIRRDELAEAQRRIEENVSDDVGRLRLATFLLLCGQLDARIADVRARLGQGHHPDDARLLTYLARAKGDAELTREAAESAQDPGLLKAVLVEQRRWAEAAKLQAAGPCPPPITIDLRLPKIETHQRIEQLGLLAAYQRLGGDVAAWEQTSAEIQGLAAAHPDDATLRWFCVEAMLLNDRVDEGLKLLAELSPSRAVDLFVNRLEYRRALELAGWREGAAVDRAWLDSLRAAGSDAAQPALPPTIISSPADSAGRDAAQQALARLESALEVARILHLLGRRQEAGQVIDLLVAYAQEQPDDERSSATPRRQCWERLCAALLAMGDQPRAWEIGARALLNPEAASPLLSRLYPQRYPEAQGWWTFFRLRDASEPPAATFARVHRVMVPVADDAEEFAKLAAEAETVAMAQDVSYGGGIVAAVGEAALRRRQFELACRLLDAAREVNPNVPSLLAEALWQSQQWAKAAATSEALWERDHEQLTALYLTGEALQRAGREDEGRQRKEQAVLLALDSRARLNLAVGLKRHGLQEEAVQQFQIALRTTPFESWEWQAAAHYLAEQMQDAASGEAAALFEQSLLDDLRTQSYLLADKDYLVTPSLTHRLRAAAAVGAGQWEAADHHIQRVLSALPGDTALTEHLVPPLEKAGRQQEADKLFEKVFGVYAEGVQAYPDAALLHNNLAWMCARCGRRLDEAQQHADRAVALEPDNAGYIDTLAEVRFQRGDREAAVRHSRRAVQLRPDDETLQRQLDRFQQAPLPDRSK